ncbi:ArsR/SmtB family transcription factor [Pontiella agarivorans]|uniref:Metalloregulator ArsR/SmtB family transcription factor n=1 Tax=Pontiella agarivorans TaxID=3038953 RepID=A0ABU5MX84_9BACT|nr:metalloregulator ArsR/SmtB family transcription factor [Pontiella agarivorans]MDZ8118823.1 metalloregulator ArsR/SmtB family transcription factor [Pontiella agarivorans]
MSKTTPCIRQGKLKVETLQRAAETLKMLAHPQRLRIIEILEREQEVPVHALVAETGFAQAVVSQHLNQMRRAGLLCSTRHGKEMWYSICDPRALSILNCICNNCTTQDFEEA